MIELCCNQLTHLEFISCCAPLLCSWAATNTSVLFGVSLLTCWIDVGYLEFFFSSSKKQRKNVHWTFSWALIWHSLLLKNDQSFPCLGINCKRKGLKCETKKDESRKNALYNKLLLPHVSDTLAILSLPPDITNISALLCSAGCLTCTGTHTLVLSCSTWQKNSYSAQVPWVGCLLVC